MTEDHPPHRAVHVHRFTHTCRQSRQLVVHSNRRQHAGHPKDESQVVDDDDHDIDDNLRSDRRVGPKVEGTVEDVAEREGARVSNRDGDRDRNTEPAAQTRQDRQIDAEGEAVDQAETKKSRRNDRSESERQPTDDRLTPLVESVPQAWLAGPQVGLHMATVT